MYAKSVLRWEVLQYSLSLLPLGMHVLTPCLKVGDISPLTKYSLTDLTKK